MLVDAPRHAGLSPSLTYRSQRPLAPGLLVRVPFGRREVAGLTWSTALPSDAPGELREIAEVCDALPSLGADWCALVEFAASYYQRSVGEIALAVLPPELRRLGRDAVADRIRRLHRAYAAAERRAPRRRPTPEPALTADQAAATGAIAAAMAGDAPGTTLLHGVTGSGKTEVYLRAAEPALAAGRQALVLVPEINLTPQLIDRFTRRFAGRRIVALHSGLTPAQRLRSWLAAQLGLADLVLGTRLAVFAPLPRLGLVVVDEEHDAVVQAAGRRALFGARPGGLARPARRRRSSSSARRRRRSRPGSAPRPAAIGASPCPSGRRRRLAGDPAGRHGPAAARPPSACAPARRRRRSRRRSSPRCTSASRAASKAWSSSTGAATRRCCNAASAAG